MSFRVKFGANEKPAEYGNEDIYDFLPSGVLKLQFAEPARWAEYYPPHAWHQVIAEDDHPQGQVGGPYDVKDSIF